MSVGRSSIAAALVLTVVTLTGLMCACGSPADAEMEAGLFRLDRLSTGDSVELEYEESGCFHRSWFTLRILGGAPCRAQVVGVDRAKMVDVAIVDADLARLQRTLEYYRDPPPKDAVCTSTSVVRVRWMHDGLVKCSEAWKDNSGLYDFPYDAVPIPRLALALGLTSEAISPLGEKGE